jgi:hypothetical protein
MQLEQTFGCPWIMGFVGNWTELWISKFSPCRFESIAPPLRNVGVDVANSAALPTTRQPRLPSTPWYQLSAGLKS